MVAGDADTALLTVLARTCRQLATACDLFADRVGRTRAAIRDAVTAALGGPTVSPAVAAALDLALTSPAARLLDAEGRLRQLFGGLDEIRREYEREVALLRHEVSPRVLENQAAATAAVRPPEPLTAAVTAVGRTMTAIDATARSAVALVAGVPLGSGVRTVVPPPLTVSRTQIEKKYEQHAAAFGVVAPRGREGFLLLESEIHAVVRAAGTIHIDGTHRARPMIIHLDAQRHLVVLQEPEGAFVSGWAPTADQERNIMERGAP